MVHKPKSENKNTDKPNVSLAPVKGENIAHQRVQLSSWRKMAPEEVASLPSPTAIKSNDERMAEYRVHIKRAKGEID